MLNLDDLWSYTVWSCLSVHPSCGDTKKCRTEVTPKEAPVMAVDFDGVLVEDAYPKIGLPNFQLFKKLIQLRAHGVKLILHTCRMGRELEDAVRLCHNLSLTFDAYNANLPSRTTKFGGDSRKISADLYLEDRALGWDPRMSIVRGLDSWLDRNCTFEDSPDSRNLKQWFLRPRTQGDTNGSVGT